MDFLDFFNISERYIELINPTSPEKILHVGEVLGLNSETRLIDFGCGYAEPLLLWAERFGISGVGIDFREAVCSKAREKIAARGLSERLEIVCADGSKHEFEKGRYDVATCIGASFIWKGFRPTIQALKSAIRPGGRLAIGEPYWRTKELPEVCLQEQEVEHTEYELLQITHSEGLEFEYIVRASSDDWDRYETANWRGLCAWLEENPNHPERQEVIDWLHKVQTDYSRCVRPYMGWAIYLMRAI